MSYNSIGNLSYILILCFVCTSGIACDVESKIAEAAYYEAEGEGFIGKVAVATVIMERFYSGKFGKSVCDVVNAPAQFSYYWDGKAERMEKLDIRLEAEEAANCVVNNKCSHAALFGVWDYYACKGRWAIPPPYWVEHYVLVAEIGNHCFYSRNKEG